MTNMSTTNELHEAIRSRNTEQLKQILSQGININALDDSTGETSLHICARLGYMEVAQTLLSLKPQLHLVDKNGWNPLHVAVYYKSDDVAKAICESKLNQNIVNLVTQKSTNTKNTQLSDEFPVGTTAGHMALLNESNNLFEYFLRFNANVFLKDELGRTPFDIAENRAATEDGYNAISTIALKTNSLCEAIKGGFVDQARLLIQSGADANQLDNKRYTALYLAVRKNQIDTTKILINGGADVNAKIYHTDYTKRYEQGLTALHLACQENNIDIVQILTQAGADVNAIDAHHYMPLHSICKQQTSMLHKDASAKVLAIVKILLEHGAIVNDSVGNSKGFTPLEMVASSRLPSSNYTKPVSILLLSAGAALPAMNVKQRENLELKLLDSTHEILTFFMEYGYKFYTTEYGEDKTNNINLVKEYETAVPSLIILSAKSVRLQMYTSSCPNLWFGVKRLGLPSNFDTNIITFYSKELEFGAR